MRSYLLLTLLLTPALSVSPPHSKRSLTDPHWTYTGTKGSLLWHTLSPTFSTCASGQHQSPIDLTPQTSTVYDNTSEPVVQLLYPSRADFRCKNDGHTVECLPVDAGEMKLLSRGIQYELTEFHWHTPSEHLVAGRYYPMEVHFVHASGPADDPSTQFAVFGIFFDIARTAAGTSDFIRQLLPTFSGRLPVPEKGLAALTEPGVEIEMKNLHIGDIPSHLASAPKLHSYAGSLTTPPCTEGISWFVVDAPMMVGLEGYRGLKRVLGFNARFTQNTLGGRNLVELVRSRREEKERRRRRS